MKYNLERRQCEDNHGKNRHDATMLSLLLATL